MKEILEVAGRHSLSMPCTNRRNELRQTQASLGGLGVLLHSWMKACSNVAPFGE